MVEVIAVHDGFWRVRVAGAPVGCIQRFEARDGQRFLARVIDARARRWTNVGEYWEFDAAVSALATP